VPHGSAFRRRRPTRAGVGGGQWGYAATVQRAGVNGRPAGARACWPITPLPLLARPQKPAEGEWSSPAPTCPPSYPEPCSPCSLRRWLAFRGPPSC
jgi:hypothetical protein